MPTDTLKTWPEKIRLCTQSNEIGGLPTYECAWLNGIDWAEASGCCTVPYIRADLVPALPTAEQIEKTMIDYCEEDRELEHVDWLGMARAVIALLEKSR